MHVNEDLVNNKTFAKYLAGACLSCATLSCSHFESVRETLTAGLPCCRYVEGAGYKVGMFGKYLNNVPNFVPVGFDAFMANGGGNYIAPVRHPAASSPLPALWKSLLCCSLTRCTAFTIWKAVLIGSVCRVAAVLRHR